MYSVSKILYVSERNNKQQADEQGGAVPGNRDAQRKKPVIKDHVLFDAIYMQGPGEANRWKQKVDPWLPEAGGVMGVLGGDGWGL